jgi:RimJ/RimL family protein N-acetyltransferase
MDYLAETKRYYAQWLSVDPKLLDKAGIFCLYSSERNKIQDGYNERLDFYAYISGQTIILTYGCRIKQEMAWIQDFFHYKDDLGEFKKNVKEKIGKNLYHDYKYYFNRLPLNINVSNARPLTQQDYPDFLRFFQELYPESEAESWLPDYFNKLVAEEYVFGVYVGDKLVSASDSPSMPYMKESLVEIGINTLPEYRGKGYAKMVIASMLNHLINLSRVPIASCASSNLASQKLLEGTGFVKFAEVVSLSL